jgi:hypothetical protein
MNYTQIRLAEECLYMRKYLYGRMQELCIVIDSIMPQGPGSVLKIVGKPVAKTPIDTSETEKWGILRATCREAVELEAKMKLFNEIATFRSGLNDQEKEMIGLLYEKEYPVVKVKTMMGLSHKSYHALRMKVLRCLWRRIYYLGEEVLESAVI